MPALEYVYERRVYLVVSRTLTLFPSRLKGAMNIFGAPSSSLPHRVLISVKRINRTKAIYAVSARNSFLFSVSGKGQPKESG